MKVVVEINMQNGDKFKTKGTEATEEEINQLKRLFSNLGKLNTFSMECEGGETYFNPSQISSIQVKECLL